MPVGEASTSMNYSAAGPRSRPRDKGPRMSAAWWASPHPFFIIPAAVFWCIILWTYIAFQLQLPELRDGLSAQDKAAIPCNAARRPVATCAHRGNAAELLRGAGVTPGSGASVLQQMQLLWKAGVGCFDMDINHLAGGDIIVGHPGDLAARVDAAALPVRGSASSSSSSKPLANITADQLPAYSLQELRAAGLSEQAAPTLQALLQQFRQLLDSGPPASSSSVNGSSSGIVSVHEAAARRSWVAAPFISLEPKGPARGDAQAFVRVSELAAAAGVSQHTVLWLRQMPPSAGVVVTDLALAVKQGQLNLTAHIRSSSAGAGSDSAAAAVGLRPLLGLIVADMLLRESALSAVQQAGDVDQLTAALLATAGGVVGSSEASQDGAAKVLDAFDVLAPSIKLPPRVLHSFAASKPCLAWTLEDEGHARRAVWLGLDVAITNTPIAQLAVIDKEGSALCNS